MSNHLLITVYYINITIYMCPLCVFSSFASPAAENGQVNKWHWDQAKAVESAAGGGFRGGKIQDCEKQFTHNVSHSKCWDWWVDVSFCGNCFKFTFNWISLLQCWASGSIFLAGLILYLWVYEPAFRFMLWLLKACSANPCLAPDFGKVSDVQF